MKRPSNPKRAQQTEDGRAKLTPDQRGYFSQAAGPPPRNKSKPLKPDEAARLKSEIEGLAAVKGHNASKWPFPELAKLSPEIGVLLGKYAVLLEQECDRLLGELEGGYFRICPQDRRRSRLALPPRGTSNAKLLSPKERHDSGRARKRGEGLIEAALRAPLAGLYLDVCSPLLCLDDLLAQKTVDMDRLSALFGENRKSFPPIPEKQKRGRNVFYDYRAFFQIAEHLLAGRTWLPGHALRLRFLDWLERRLGEGQCPAEVSKAGAKFVVAARRRIRESAAPSAEAP